MQRAILHLDLDSFFVSVERLFDKSLIGKPVIVGGTSNRGVVSSCSYEARKFGVHSAMPIVKARRLCPQGIFVSGHMHEYSRFSGMVTDIIAERAPLFEKASIDEFYIDLTGMERFFGVYEWSTALRKKIIDETNLPISFGLSVNKMLAKMATNEAKPNGQYMIEPGKEQDFLDALPVSKIPMCGDKTSAFLKAKGIDTIAQLRSFPHQALQNWLGRHGTFLWNRANGIDNGEVHPYHDPKSMSSERTFDTDTNDANWLKKVIISLSEKLAFELRSDKKLSSCVAIKIRYSDFSTHTKQMAIPFTSNSKILMEKALHLFDDFYDRERKVRLIGVKFSDLTEGSYQINLFDDREKDILLYKAIDELKNKHGAGKITLAQNLGISNVKRNSSLYTLNKEVQQDERKLRKK
ncbi:MAG TPA: DNA polymerase IV [Chitinophagales bacterium]|nr:DNA polymerase IV [Chitinophagales bacterium]